MDEENKDTGKRSPKVKVLGIDLADLGKMTMEEVIEKLKNGMTEIFDKTHPPVAYWHAFKEHYELDDLKGIAHDFSAYIFFNGMRAMIDIIADLTKIEDDELKKVAVQIINAMVREECRHFAPKSSGSGNESP